MTIVVVEDERTLARNLVSALRRQGHEAVARHDGIEGEREILQLSPDLVVLDLTLPGRDGWEVLARLRQWRTQTRVLILTARADLESRVAGLRAGADDYLPKPFAMEELVARCEALGRRSSLPPASARFAFGDLKLDVVQRRAVRGDRLIDLTTREFELLQVLLAEPGRVFSRGELSERVWQRDHFYGTRTVEMFITRLRRKVDQPGLPPLVHTVRGSGYTLRQDVHAS